MPNNYSSATP